MFRKLDDERLFKIERHVAKKWMQYEEKIESANLDTVKNAYIECQKSYFEGFFESMILTGCYEEEKIVREFLNDFEADYYEGTELLDENGEVKDEFLLNW